MKWWTIVLQNCNIINENNNKKSGKRKQKGVRFRINCDNNYTNENGDIFLLRYLDIVK